MTIPAPFELCLDEAFMEHGFDGPYRGWLVEPPVVPKRSDSDADRSLKLLLEDDHVVGRSEVALRAMLLNTRYPPESLARAAAGTMAWGVRTRVLEPCNDDHGLWKVLRPGVAYVPRGNGSLDVRDGNPRGRCWSMPALARREQRFRDDKNGSRKRAAYKGVLDSLRRIDPDAKIPERPGGNHLPPVATIGELLENIGGFWEQMPRWALAELRASLGPRHYDRRDLAATVPPLVAPAPELDDLTL